jgi:hypothetical protein
LTNPSSLAIGVGFSVSDGGGSVGILDYYTVSDDVAVHESGTGGYSPASISSSRTVSGPGSINMVQKYMGSGGYNGFNRLFSRNALANNVQSNVALSPNTLSLSQSASFSNADLVEFCLGACMGSEFVKQYGRVEDGSLRMDQSLSVGGGMQAGINSEIEAEKAFVGSRAGDSLGSRADTYVEIHDGKLSTSQIAGLMRSPNDIIAYASQDSEILALAAVAKSWSNSHAGNRAGVMVELTDGKMVTNQNAWADNLAAANEVSKVWAAKGASSSSYAGNAEGDIVYSKVKADLSNGTFDSKQVAVGDYDLALWHDTNASQAFGSIICIRPDPGQISGEHICRHQDGCGQFRH